MVLAFIPKDGCVIRTMHGREIRLHVVVLLAWFPNIVSNRVRIFDMFPSIVL